MGLILFLNITQHNSYGVFGILKIVRKARNSYHKDLRNSDPDKK